MPNFAKEYDEIDNFDTAENFPSGEHQYTFIGRVQPERVGITLGRLAMCANENIIDLSIYNSRIKAIVYTDNEVEEETTLRNTVVESVYSITDIMAFTHGVGYTVLIDVLIRPDGSQRVFGVNIPALENKLDEENKAEYRDKIGELLRQPDNEYLRMALKNLRLAMSDPVDSPMFCYRAIEALRKEFEEEKNVSQNNSWEELWDYIDYDGKSFREMADEYGHASRHGRRISISNKDRAELFDITWTIIRKYINEKYRSLEKDPG